MPMADSTSTPEGFSFKRWSRRKLEAARVESAEPAPATLLPATLPPAPAAAVASAAPDAATSAAIEDSPSLPPIESLTKDSDFSAFMQPKVDAALQRAALKKLFTDPHFNVMDGLDIYIGDYTQPDPMPEGMLEKLGKVYGMAKEAVADEVAAPAVRSVVPVDADAPADAPEPAIATTENSDAPATTESGALPALSAPDPQATLPPPAAPAVAALPAVPEATR